MARHFIPNHSTPYVVRARRRATRQALRRVAVWALTLAMLAACALDLAPPTPEPYVPAIYAATEPFVPTWPDACDGYADDSPECAPWPHIVEEVD